MAGGRGCGRATAALLFVALGCGPTNSPHRTQSVDLSPPPADSRRSSPTPEPAKAVDPDAALCGGRAGCSVVSKRPAGADALEVVLLSLGTDNLLGGGNVRPSSAVSDATSDTFEATYGGCARHEYWLVGRAEPKKLIEICNDGHGASGVGQDIVRIPGNGTLLYSVSGGSTWRWSRDVEISLDPLRLVRENENGFWAMGENEEAQSWSWRTFAGLTVAVAPKCDKTGAPMSDTTERAFIPVPAVAIDPAYVNAWQDVSLGECAARAGVDERGFVLEGNADADDAAIAVVKMGDNVYVEITDDQMTNKDALEVWVTTAPTSWMDMCLGSGPAPVRASVSPLLKAGPVPSRRGAARLQLIKLTPDRRKLRTVWALPVVNARFTVAYRDSDDNNRFERVIATSDLDPQDPSSIGATRPIPPGRFACEVDGGVLHPVARDDRGADAPFVD